VAKIAGVNHLQAVRAIEKAGFTLLGKSAINSWHPGAMHCGPESEGGTVYSDSASGPANVVNLRSVKPAESSLGTRARIVLLALFLFVTLPVTPLLVVSLPVLQPLLAVHLTVHAVPLFLTAVIDSWLLDAGEVTPELIPLWSVLTGVMLWPLLALSLWPALWDSNSWRKAILAYGVVALLATIGAAYWVFTHLGIFF